MNCISPIAIDMRVCVCVCLCVCVCMCVSMCVYAAFVDARKTVEVETSFFKLCGMTNRITNSKMEDKRAAVKHYNWL